MRKAIVTLSVIFYVLLLAGCSKVQNDKPGVAPPGVYNSMGPGSSGSSGGNQGPANPAGVITAGEWNDLDHWSFWMSLMDTVSWKEKQDYWKLYVNNRFSVQLIDEDNNNIPDAEILIRDELDTWTMKTDNFGKAEFFPSLFTNTFSNSYAVKAIVNGLEFQLGSFTASVHTLAKQLNIRRITSSNVDVMFVVDATGSMGDELGYLQNELNDVIARAQTDLPGMILREGSVFYRDAGDEYLTRDFPFTTRVGSLISFIKDQQADGGGDFPEAVHAGLKDALENQNWSNGATTRLLFLVLDAPPHHEDAIIQSIQMSIREAQQKGIKIIPVTASGIDKETEFLMRFMAIATNGSYVFITDDSGIGNPHLSPTVGTYQVEFLNDLMVRLIKKYSKL